MNKNWLKYSNVFQFTIRFEGINMCACLVLQASNVQFIAILFSPMKLIQFVLFFSYLLCTAITFYMIKRMNYFSNLNMIWNIPDKRSGVNLFWENLPMKKKIKEIFDKHERDPLFKFWAMELEQWSKLTQYSFNFVLCAISINWYIEQE